MTLPRPLAGVRVLDFTWVRDCRYCAGSSTYARYCASLGNGKQLCLVPMDGALCSPAGLDWSLHRMGKSGEPSYWFFGLHPTNHTIRWNQKTL